MTTAQKLCAANPTLLPRTLVAGAIGNVLARWYDFAAYGYFASCALGRNFFPSTSHLDLAALSVRRISPCSFYDAADRKHHLSVISVTVTGCKRALIAVSVSAMALFDFVIGLLPTYAQIGSLAPLILILLRMVQGVSVGGEYTTSIIFLVEQSAPNQARIRRKLGLLLCYRRNLARLCRRSDRDAPSRSGGGACLGLATSPFLPGIALGAVAYVMRRRLLEEDYTRVHFVRLPLRSKPSSKPVDARHCPRLCDRPCVRCRVLPHLCLSRDVFSAGRVADQRDACAHDQ